MSLRGLNSKDLRGTGSLPWAHGALSGWLTGFMSIKRHLYPSRPECSNARLVLGGRNVYDGSTSFDELLYHSNHIIQNIKK